VKSGFVKSGSAGSVGLGEREPAAEDRPDAELARSERIAASGRLERGALGAVAAAGAFAARGDADGEARAWCVAWRALEALGDEARAAVAWSRLATVATLHPSAEARLALAFARALAAAKAEEPAAAHAQLRVALTAEAALAADGAAPRPGRVPRGTIVALAAYVEAFTLAPRDGAAAWRAALGDAAAARALAALVQVRLAPPADDAGLEALTARVAGFAIDDVFKAAVLHVALRRCGAGARAATRLRAATTGARWLDANALWRGLLDFEAEAIAALAQGRRLGRARRRLEAYLAAAEAQGASARLRRGAALGALLRAHARLEAADGDGRGARVGDGRRRARRLVVDAQAHRVRLDARTIDLARRPLVEALLALLVAAGGPVALDVVFERLYGTSYDPEAHEARLVSLIARSRRSLGDGAVILRRGGALTLAGDVAARLDGASAGIAEAVTARRQRLERLVAAAKRPVRVRELAARIPASRRTLQGDLAALVAAGRLAAVGGRTVRGYVYADATREAAARHEGDA
jgi:hypothetical protein